MDLKHVYTLFPDHTSCLEYLEAVRWQNKPVCPYCLSEKYTKMPSEMRYHCNSCNTSYSVTVGTIFHHTHLDMQKWFLAIYIIFSTKKPVSARKLAELLDINKNTACQISSDIKNASGKERSLLMKILKTENTTNLA
ncbi:MAG: IS1595 family transposase [Candidatus Omnitrophica bacterium]|nr:IS1595 family transposase [Candidatus Omnitrophota bacterium]